MFGVQQGAESSWEVGDCVSMWYRPAFEPMMVRRACMVMVSSYANGLVIQYPYLPAHITKPKECKKMFLVQMPEKSTYHVSGQH
jgi:cleavage and polyadenylation specificity factor subunit 5